jgi:WASH complex subunit 7
LSVFGDATNEQAEEGEKQLQLGRGIPLLMDLWNFCERVNSVVQNVVQQLAAIYNAKNIKNQSGMTGYQNVHFLPVYVSLSDLLGVMITLDEMIQQNQSFAHHLTLYNRYCINCIIHPSVLTFYRMISKVMEEPERFGTDKKSAGRIHYLLQKIDGDLLDDNIFKVWLLLLYSRKLTSSRVALVEILKMNQEELQFKQIQSSRKNS